MSLYGPTRERLAAALGLTVTDDGATYQLEPHALEPHTPTALQTFPRWQQTTWLTRRVKEISWHVIVVLPAGDLGTWTAAAEALIDPIRDALDATAQAAVSMAEPASMSFQDGAPTVPVLRFTVTTTG